MWPEAAGTEEILLQVKRGEPGAEDRLLGRHREGLRRMVDARLDRALRRRVDASDIVQEVLIEAHRRLSGYLADPRQPFHLWLRAIARDHIIDAHRRHRKAARRTLDREETLGPPGLADRSSVELVRELQAPGPSPSAVAIRNEVERRFHRALEEMGEDDREVLLLRHFEGLSNGEAARALGLSDSAAGMRYLRALRRLRELLDRPGGTGGRKDGAR